MTKTTSKTKTKITAAVAPSAPVGEQDESTPTRSGRFASVFSGAKRAATPRFMSKSPRRVFLGAMATGAAGVATYAIVVASALLATPETFRLVASVSNIDFATATVQQVLAFWAAPSLMLVGFVFALALATIKAVWRWRKRVVEGPAQQVAATEPEPRAERGGARSGRKRAKGATA